MRNLLICNEYPPAPLDQPGGIGTYAVHIARLLVQAGETVHVIATRWEGASKPEEEHFGGRLVVHRVSPELADPTHLVRGKAEADIRGLYQSSFAPQAFSMLAALKAEQLVNGAGIDVVESQEFHAPLYYFQLRRALGMGPRRVPPCIIHLHSPSDSIVRFNEYDGRQPFFVTAKRLEAYSIAAADAHLCPSHYLARQVESEFGLAAGSTEVIPYPMGDTPGIERSTQTWASGAICYVGRLELRKGVVEWVDAAVCVAAQDPDLEFEFVGGDLRYDDTASVREHLEKRIPASVRERFHFRGPQPKQQLLNILGRARLAVVPSRWDNFPNACIEAMSTGLPVLASRDGGMVEMIEDGETGWIAPSSSKDGLVDALRRALAVSPGERARMGDLARRRIHSICDNDETVSRHLEFRERTVRRGSHRSSFLAPDLNQAEAFGADTPRSDESPKARETYSHTASERGIAVVVTSPDDAGMLGGCLRRIRDQSVRPASVVIVCSQAMGHAAWLELNRGQEADWSVIQSDAPGPTAARDAGIAAALSQHPHPLAFVFLEQGDWLDREFISTCEAILTHRPEVGVLAPWIRLEVPNSRLFANPCPAFPHQLLGDETAPTTVFRTKALLAVKRLPKFSEGAQDKWDYVNEVLARGWKGVTVPSSLATRKVPTDTTSVLKLPRCEYGLLEGLVARAPISLGDRAHLFRSLRAYLDRADTAPAAGPAAWAAPRPAHQLQAALALLAPQLARVAGYAWARLRTLASTR